MRNPHDRSGCRSGFALIELAGAVIALVILVVLTSLGRARSTAGEVRDATQLKELMTVCMIFASESNGRFPLPGLIDRLPDPQLGDIPGRGPQDFARNHTADLYSALITQNYFMPELVVSPLEVNQSVVMKADFDWSSYNPAEDVYWDERFVARIDDPDIGSNASYAHAALCGDRRELRWRETRDTHYPCFGLRGTAGGVTEGERFSRSPTLRFMAPDDLWACNIAFADGHVERVNSFYREGTSFEIGGDRRPDNMLAAEFEHPNGAEAAADAFLSVSRAADEHSVEAVYDPLD